MNIHDRDPDTIVFAGDWHGNLYQAQRVIDEANLRNSDTIIQLGDFGIWHDDHYPSRFLKGLNNQAKKAGIVIYFVDGNHENFDHLYSYPLAEDGTRPIRSNIIHLPRGFRFTWGGVRYVALGGAHSVDKHMRKPGHSWWTQEWVTDEEIERTISGGIADVMLMHDSPQGAPNPVIDDPYNEGAKFWPAYQLADAASHRERLRPAVEAVDPVMLFHGHYHRFQVQNYRQPTGTITTVWSLDEGAASRAQHMTYASREMLQLAAEAQRSE